MSLTFRTHRIVTVRSRTALRAYQSIQCVSLLKEMGFTNFLFLIHISYIGRSRRTESWHDTVCPTRYRTRHFFNNSNTNEDIATRFEQEYVRCVRNLGKHASFQLCAGVPSGVFSSPHQNSVFILLLPRMCHMPCLSHPSWSDPQNNTGWTVQIMKLLNM